MKYPKFILALCIALAACSPAQAPTNSDTTATPQDIEMQKIVHAENMSDEAIKMMDGGQKEEGLKLLIQASDEGSTTAQIMVAMMYFMGKDVPKDAKKAIELLEKAAVRNPTAAVFLGETYAEGKDVPQDYGIARHWYQQGADAGNPVAQQHLGVMYELGHGTVMDKQKAVEWYKKAAENGNADAQASLAFMYSKGDGVPESFDKSIEYARQAAMQGDERTQFLMGGAYLGGGSIPMDYVQAYAWFSLSKAGGLPDADEFLTKISKNMTKEQIAEGQRLSTELYDQIQSKKRGGI